MSQGDFRKWVWLAILGLAATTGVLLVLRYQPSIIDDTVAGQWVPYWFFDFLVARPVDWLATHTSYWQYTLIALALCVHLLIYTRNLKSEVPGALPLSRLAVTLGGLAFTPIAAICLGLATGLGIHTVGEFWTAAAAIVAAITIVRRVRRRIEQRRADWERDLSQTPEGRVTVARRQQQREAVSDSLRVFAGFAVIPLALLGGFVWWQYNNYGLVPDIWPRIPSILALPAAAAVLGLAYDLVTADRGTPRARALLRQRRLILAFAIIAGAVAHAIWRGMRPRERFDIEEPLFRYVYDYGWLGSLVLALIAWFVVLGIPVWRARGSADN